MAYKKNIYTYVTSKNKMKKIQCNTIRSNASFLVCALTFPDLKVCLNMKVYVWCYIYTIAYLKNVLRKIYMPQNKPIGQ